MSAHQLVANTEIAITQLITMHVTEEIKALKKLSLYHTFVSHLPLSQTNYDVIIY